MEINERIRAIRNSLGLTQTEFGNKIGLKQNTVGQIENGQRGITDRTIILICQSYNVSEEWLRDGEGEMFVENDNVLLSQLAKQYDLDAFSRKFIETYISLPQSHRDVIQGFARSLAEEASAPAVPEVTIGGSKVDDAEIAAELSVLARELQEEKRVAEKSSDLTSAKDA